MSLIRFLKWDIEAINSQMTNFFWDDQGDKLPPLELALFGTKERVWWIGYPYFKRS
jgi:hypothetical protein